MTCNKSSHQKIKSQTNNLCKKSYFSSSERYLNSVTNFGKIKDCQIQKLENYIVFYQDPAVKKPQIRFKSAEWIWLYNYLPWRKCQRQPFDRIAQFDSSYLSCMSHLSEIPTEW